MIANPVVSDLADPERLNPLDAGEPAAPLRGRLAELTVARLVAPGTLHDRAAAEACLAGLWLHYNFLTEAHAISQVLTTPEGSYWHGIMHRREPDAANAAYWMRRAGEHPIHAELQRQACELLRANAHDSRADFILAQARWNAISFIDLAELYRGTRSQTEKLCQQLQLCEWRLLFNYCWQKATGTLQPGSH